jgi:hypothetical protein
LVGDPACAGQTGQGNVGEVSSKVGRDDPEGTGDGE